MKITGLRTIEVAASRRGNWIFVLVDTDAGLTGLGEASQSGNDGLVKEALAQLGDRLVGEDPTQPEVVWEKTARSTAVFSGIAGRVGATAISAVDQALWDLAGKALEVPVWRLLGGRRRDRVRLYANLNRGTQDRSPEGFARAAAAAVQAGFRAVKCTPFDEVQYRSFDRDHVDADVDRGVERLAASREAIGPHVELLVDCHCRFDLPLALKVADRIRDLNLFWLEEPIPRDQIDSLAQITRQCGITTAGGESLFGRGAFWEYVASRAVHILMPDVKHAGGITECRRIAALAEVRQMPVAPHNPAGPVSTLASVHLAATVQNFLVLEYAFGEVPWREQLIQPPERLVDGFISVPDAPGLGIDLDEAMAAAHGVIT